VFSGSLCASVLIAAPLGMTSAVPRVEPASFTSFHTLGIRTPGVGAASRPLHRCFLGDCVLQAGLPAIPENGQGGFVSSLPPLTFSRTWLKRRTRMTHSSLKQPKLQPEHKHPTKLANSFSGTVPRALVRCPVCHEYHGAVRNSDLPPSSQREEAVVVVLCICNGIPCRTCGESRIHRPISNYWDEARGALIHCPWFSAQVSCDTCSTQHKWSAA
jgi:hypothetical protein